jgi:hypothetical protein
MRPQDAGNRNSSDDQLRGTRNPFDVMDVPNPNDQEVLEFAAGAKLAGTSDDENARAWTAPSDRNQPGAIEGNWSSRWNGGADPTIPGDAGNKWKQGAAEVRTTGDRSISCSTGTMERAGDSSMRSARAQQGWLESISI